MLSKTHITVGMASALAITQPATAPGLICAIAGGGLGGWICDIDVRENPNRAELAKSLPAIALVLAASLALDRLGNLGIVESVVASADAGTALGLAMFAALAIIGVATPHRTFTHSLLCLVLWTLSGQLVSPQLGAAFSIGIASHLLLDLFNRKGQRLLFPLKKRFCLNVCASDGRANQVLGGIGLIASIVLCCCFGVRILAENGSVSLAFAGLQPLAAYLVCVNAITVATCVLYLLFGTASETAEFIFVHAINALAVLGGSFAFFITLLFVSVSNHRQNDTPVVVRGDDGNSVSYLIAASTTVAWLIVIALVGNGFGIFQGLNVNPYPEFHYPLLAYLAAVNIAAFVLFLLDRAVRRKFHLKEALLMLLAFVGGAAGAILAMALTGTKQGQTHFKYGLPVLLVFNAIMVAFLVVNGIV